MSDSNSLIFLVRSMNKAEKRYFKIHYENTQHGKKYINIFNVINNKKEWPPEQIEDYLKQNIPDQAYHFRKNKLFKSLTYSLVSQYKTKSKLGEILTYIEIVEILYHKRLYSIAYKMIVKAKQLVVEFERYSLLIEIAYWERILLAKFDTKKVPQPFICGLNLSKNKLKNYLLLTTKKNHFLEDDTFLMKVYTYDAAIQENFGKQDFEKGKLLIRQMINSWKEDSKNKKLYPELYLEYIQGFFLKLLPLKCKEELIFLRLKIKETNLIYSTQWGLFVFPKDLFSFLYDVHFNYRAQTYLQGQALINDFNSVDQLDVGLHLEFQFHMLGCYYFADQKKLRQNQLKNLLENSVIKNDLPNWISLQLLQALEFFLSQNYSVFESRIRSCYRHLLRKLPDCEFLKFIINFIRQLLTYPNKHELSKNIHHFIRKTDAKLAAFPFVIHPILYKCLIFTLKAISA